MDLWRNSTDHFEFWLWARLPRMPLDNQENEQWIIEQINLQVLLRAHMNRASSGTRMLGLVTLAEAAVGGFSHVTALQGSL